MARKTHYQISSQGPRFERVTDPLQIRRIRAQVEDESLQAMLWDPRRQKALQGQIKTSDIENEWVLRGAWRDQVLDFPHQFPGVFGVIYPRQAVIIGFVPEEIEERGESEFQFRVPNEFYFIQRRKDERATIPRGYEIWATYPSPARAGEREQIRIYDLSEKGLALQVPQAESALYRKGMILPNLQFQIRGRRMTGSLQIQNIVSIDDKIAKVGGHWLKLSEADREWLSQYVIEWRMQK